MEFSVGDLLRLSLFGVYNAVVRTINVFHYTVTATDGDAANNAYSAAGRAFWNIVGAALVAPTSSVVRYNSILVEKMDVAEWLAINGEEFTIPEETAFGLIDTEVLPPYSCYTFKYVRPSTDYRHGFKRFVGVPENGQATGFLSAGYETMISDIRDQLGAQLAPCQEGDELTSDSRIVPVIYKAHRFGEDVRPVQFSVPASIVFDGIGTQNTRKFGRGI